MCVGDLVRCRFFNRYGIVISEPIYEYNSKNTSKNLKKEILWVHVLWDNGIILKWKAEFLEVLNGIR